MASLLILPLKPWSPAGKDSEDPYSEGEILLICIFLYYHSSFDGLLTLWQLNCSERERITKLPARRLKALLDARGVPYADLTERADFVRRVQSTGALPPATRLKAMTGHAGPVPGASHSGDVLVTGGNDGTARIWSLATGTHEVVHAGAAGVDSVAYEASRASIFTGNKVGCVYQFDANRPGSAPLASWQASKAITPPHFSRHVSHITAMLKLDRRTVGSGALRLARHTCTHVGAQNRVHPPPLHLRPS